MAAWSDESTNAALEMVKTDLGILQSTLYDNRLRQYVISAHDEIIRQGVSDLTGEVSDLQLVAAFAGWLWRNRDTGDGLPVWLRRMLNNRIVQPHMQ